MFLIINVQRKNFVFGCGFAEHYAQSILKSEIALSFFFLIIAINKLTLT